MGGEVVGAGNPDHQDGSGYGDSEHSRERAGDAKDVPGCGSAEGEHVGAGGEAREAEGDGEIFGAEPLAAVELALENGDGGIAAAEHCDADAGEEASEGGECRARHGLNRFALQTECGSSLKDSAIIGPNLIETSALGGGQMYGITGADAGLGRFRSRHFEFAHLLLENATHFRNAPCGCVQSGGLFHYLPDGGGIRLVDITFGYVGGIKVQVQERSSSKMRPLSPTRFILEVIASRSGNLRVGGSCPKCRNSATGTPDFSTMKDSPARTALALVCK